MKTANTLRRWCRALSRSVFEVYRPARRAMDCGCLLPLSPGSHAAVAQPGTPDASRAGSAKRQDACRSPRRCALSLPPAPRATFPRIPLGRALVTTLLIGGLLVQPLAGQGAWELDPEVIHPSEREKHTLTQLGSKIYCFGGKDAAGTALNDLWAFDLATQSWSQLTPTGTPPPARSSHQAVAVGQSVYILFGKGAAGTALSDIWRYNVTTNTWEQRPSTGSPLPAGRFDFTAAIYLGSRITIYGGYTSDGVFADANAWNYNATTTGAWTQRAANPAGPVAEAQIIHYVHPDTGEYHDLVFCGNTPSGLSSQIHHYNPAANNWNAIPLEPSSDPLLPGKLVTVVAGMPYVDQAKGLALLAMIFGGQGEEGDNLVNVYAVAIVLNNLSIEAKIEGPLSVGITGAAAAITNPNLTGALRNDWAKNYALRATQPPVVEWDATTQAGRLLPQPRREAVKFADTIDRLRSPQSADGGAPRTEHPASRVRPSSILSLLKPGAFLKAALPAALALPSFSLTGNGADGTPLSEFMVFGGRVNGVVSAQQARLTVGNIYFPPTIVRQGNGLLRISWPDSIIGGVTLQHSATLTPATSWADVPGTPTHGAGVYYLDVDPTSYNGGRHFFRLKAP